MSNKKFRFILMLISTIFALSVFLCSCQTLKNMESTTDYMTFKSVPTNAKIYINGDYKGITPKKLILNKKLIQNVVLMKEDYNSVCFKLISSNEEVWLLLDTNNFLYNKIHNNRIDNFTELTIELNKK